MTLLISSCLWVVFIFLGRALSFDIYLILVQGFLFLSMMFGLVVLIAKVIRKRETRSFAIKVILIALFNYFYLAGIAYKTSNMILVSKYKEKLREIGDFAMKNEVLRSKGNHYFNTEYRKQPVENNTVTPSFYNGVNPSFADSLVSLIRSVDLDPREIRFMMGETSIYLFHSVLSEVRLHYKPDIAVEKSFFL